MGSNNTNNENYRDMSVPYTDAELEAFRPLFKSLKGYNPEGDYILTSDFPEHLKLMRYERTEEQVKNYQTFWDKYYDGKMTWKFFDTGARTIYNPSLAAMFHAKQIDKNGEGYMQVNDFLCLLEYLTIHEPKLTRKLYTDFITEVNNTIKGGKVSYQDCADWVAKYMTF